MLCSNQGLWPGLCLHLDGDEACARTGLKAAESMQAEDWILYSMTHQAELARVRCGGWRRQYTHIVTSPSMFTFACYRHRDIHIDRRSINDSSTLPSKSYPSTTG